MNHDTAHSEEVVLDREDGDVCVLLEIAWRFNGGEFLEPGHSRNGYGRGFECVKVEAWDLIAGIPVLLTEREQDRFREEFSPERIPNPLDNF